RGHRHTAARAEDRMLAVLTLGRVRVAHVAARPVAIDAAAVIPAARVLADVAAQRARIADLRTGHAARRAREQAEALLYQGMGLDLGERRQRTDGKSAIEFTHAFQLCDTGQVDDRPGALDAV